MAASNPLVGLGAVPNNKGTAANPMLLYPAWAGQSLDANSVLVKYTWNGDTNLDGVINADDYFLIDSGFILQAEGWYNGDFNYDGVVNADDYFLIDSAFIGQSGPLSAEHSRMSAVPEPGALGLLWVCSAALMARRRRHRQPF